MPTGRVLFMVPYPERHAPSQRFRVELFEPCLQKKGISYTIAPFMDEKTWNILYRKGSSAQKAWGICKGYLKRWKTVLFDVPKYQYVFIHREAAPLGPPIFEWIIAKLWRKKIIYDFDDAIWIPNTSSENKLASLLKAHWKVKQICRWARTVVGGNDYLCKYARKYNRHVVMIPTTVDMERAHTGIHQHGDGQVTVGWTGSHSTLFYLDDVIPVLQKLQEGLDFSFVVIANKDPELPLKNYRFVPWNATTEVSDLQQIDIGIMPLQEDAWSEGKCGFKLIQYMSLGIPAVASGVGVNKTIIDNGINGYLCYDNNAWKSSLKKLITDVDLRKNFGAKGQAKIAAQYSLASQETKFLLLFR